MKTKNVKENLKKTKITPVFAKEMKKTCRQHVKDNNYDCPSCKFEYVCSVMQYNSYPRFWELKKMVLK